LNVKAVVLPLVVSDGLCDLIEPELLSFSIVSPSLEPHVSITMHLSNSIEWKFRDKIEWSIDVETEFFIQSLSLNLSGLVKIKYIPSLSSTSVVIFNSNSLTFFILFISNTKNFAVRPVDELASFVFEYLEPI
jgi:hypothetical protein